MTTPMHVVFPPFRLDPANEQVWRGSEPVALRPKPFALLRYLAEHPGRLITNEELRRAIWRDTAVSEDVLRGYVRDVRRALGDLAATPRFVETVARRGYRFIAATTRIRPPLSLAAEPSPAPVRASPPEVAHDLVGRDAELARLHRWRDEALAGQRRLVFVSGELGVGKTALVEAFLPEAGAGGPAWIGRGQCVERYGTAEPYGPVLESLARLGRQAGWEPLVAVLARTAPTWLTQLPTLIDDAELPALERRAHGATPQRMLRELAEAIEDLTVERPLVLVIEDLQWADHSTLDLIATLARRPEPARFLLVATYRPADLIASVDGSRSLARELCARGHAHELALACLPEAAVAEYVRHRFRGEAVPAGLARLVHRRTDGNPLFMVNVVDYLVGRGLLGAASGAMPAGVRDLGAVVPDSLRQTIERQVEALEADERRTLEVASVAGVEFTTTAVAGALAEAEEVVEERCHRLARAGRFVHESGTETWPDGTVSARYGFTHALYQAVLYERVAAGRRADLHRRIAEREEAGRGAHAGERAAALAMHFERGRDYERAVRYLGQAAHNALERCAYAESIDGLTRALAWLRTLAEGPARDRQEIVLQTTLGAASMAARGYTAPDVVKAYSRARELCETVGDPSQLFHALRGLWSFHVVRSELPEACALGEQLIGLAAEVKDPAFLVAAHRCLGTTLVFMGEPLRARAELERALAFYDPRQPDTTSVRLFGHNQAVLCRNHLAESLWLLGYPDQALRTSEQAIAEATTEPLHPYSLVFALVYGAYIHRLRREPRAARERAEAAIALSTEHGLPFWMSTSTILRGWALVEEGHAVEGIARLEEALAASRTTGARPHESYSLGMLADAYAKAGQAGRALDALEEGLAHVEGSGERSCAAELYRVKGEILARRARRGGRRGPDGAAEACFRQALAIARGQHARSFELRAATSLGRLLQRRGQPEQARQVLTEITAWFTEGLDTADLREARALLSELA